MEDRYEFPGNIINDEELEKMEDYPYWEKYYFNNLLFHLEQKLESCKSFRLKMVNWNNYWDNEYDLHFSNFTKFSFYHQHSILVPRLVHKLCGGFVRPGQAIPYFWRRVTEGDSPHFQK